MPYVRLRHKVRAHHGDLPLYAAVDAEDYERVTHYHWSAVKNGRTFYAETRLPGRKRLQMHRFILGLTPTQYADHRYQNGLDNRRDNLWIATKQQNAFNMKPRVRHVTSLYKGVSWDARQQKWLAGIKVDGRRRTLG